MFWKMNDICKGEEIVVSKKDPTVLIANVITEMIYKDCDMSAIMDAVVLSKKVIDSERISSMKKEG